MWRKKCCHALILACALVMLSISPGYSQGTTFSQGEDLFTTLTMQHNDLRLLLVQLKGTENSQVSDRESLFTQFVNLFLPHARAEELTWYPQLVQNDRTRPFGYDAFQEHHAVYLLLYEMLQLPKDSDIWKAKAEALFEAVMSHVREEEGVDFELSRMVFTSQQLQTLRASFLGLEIVVAGAMQESGVAAVLLNSLCYPQGNDIALGDQGVGGDLSISDWGLCIAPATGLGSAGPSVPGPGR